MIFNFINNHTNTQSMEWNIMNSFGCIQEGARSLLSWILFVFYFIEWASTGADRGEKEMPLILKMMGTYIWQTVSVCLVILRKYMFQEEKMQQRHSLVINSMLILALIHCLLETWNTHSPIPIHYTRKYVFHSSLCVFNATCD